jgi:hypothetical protein
VAASPAARRVWSASYQGTASGGSGPRANGLLAPDFVLGARPRLKPGSVVRVFRTTEVVPSADWTVEGIRIETDKAPHPARSG